ncbi:HD domain-containing protein [Hymenobacter guriensis]|uniref:Metal-dependent phosphohydrolase n=1 Tax=Hymenobacter guriensis TaxID=2793065 RepID=A0ABS0KZU0_9BACT|nr:hypothetical protein [Hymenobacter guriensis]MBG8553388.1 hypothetical protein [Hymenobacter guriensis]
MQTTLPARWEQLTTPIVSDETCRTETLRQLTELYTGSGRHYHTLTHVQDLLQTIDEYANNLQDVAVVQLAAWFHDAIYNPLHSDNEAKSAELAREFLRHSQWPAERQERVVLLIERTQDHTQPQPQDSDLHFFLDADLQVLGRPEADYWQYARQIHQEYRLVPDVLYRRGRRKVLEKLLAVPQLYRTATFRDKLQDAARRNLQAELQAWEQGGLA